MKTITFLLLTLLLAGTSCSDLWDDDEIFNENIEVTGLVASNDYYGYNTAINWDNYNNSGEHTQIPAASYVIKIEYYSDNTYASKYGIAPHYNGALNSLTIRSLNKISNQIDSATILNDYFLVSKGEYDNSLYNHIDDYLNDKSSFSDIDLVFAYNNFANKIHFFDKQLNHCVFEVAITFDNNEQYKDTVSITLVK